MNTVAPGDTVVLHYRLAAGTGEELEGTFGGEPATITLGQGELAENLERCLIGLASGEQRVFLLPPEQAFGHCDPALLQRLPRAAFPPDMAVAPRALIRFTLPNGNDLVGTVVECGAETVVVDFNHPLCDCPVQFEVQVLAIRRRGNPAPERR